MYGVEKHRKYLGALILHVIYCLLIFNTCVHMYEHFCACTCLHLRHTECNMNTTLVVD